MTMALLHTTNIGPPCSYGTEFPNYQITEPDTYDNNTPRRARHKCGNHLATKGKGGDDSHESHDLPRSYYGLLGNSVLTSHDSLTQSGQRARSPNFPQPRIFSCLGSWSYFHLQLAGPCSSQPKTPLIEAEDLALSHAIDKDNISDTTSEIAHKPVISHSKY